MKEIQPLHDWMREQVLTDDSDNILFLGQTIEEVSEDKAVLCPLGPGEVSLHHGWTMHSSTPNKSSDRRIGLNIQYIKPSMRQQNLESKESELKRKEKEMDEEKNDLNKNVMKVFNVKNSVNLKTSYGGTSTKNIKKMISKLKREFK